MSEPRGKAAEGLQAVHTWVINILNSNETSNCANESKNCLHKLKMNTHVSSRWEENLEFHWTFHQCFYSSNLYG
jgi:hypothetical protein